MLGLTCKNWLFDSDRYGDTVFVEDDNLFRIVKLFGMEMECSPYSPLRAAGIVDIFSSLGSTDHDQSVRTVLQENNCLRVELDLYQGRMRYMSEFIFDEAYGMIRRRDTLKNVSGTTVFLMKVKPHMVLLEKKYRMYTQQNSRAQENSGAWRDLSPAGVMLSCEQARTTQGSTPMLGLQDQEGNGVVFHLIPRGNWDISLKSETREGHTEGQYLLEYGDSNDHFFYELKNGETYEVPELIMLSLFRSGLLQSAENLQRYFMDTDKTGTTRCLPLVYNTWIERHDRLDLTHLKETAKCAQDLGCEIFVIDSGWWGNCEKDDDLVVAAEIPWFLQIGDWTEKQDGALCGQVKQFAEYVRSLGMGFGLWMEPERFCRYSPAYKSHPSYFAEGTQGFYYLKLWEKEPREWMYAQISELIQRYELDWIKIDFNYQLENDPVNTEFHRYYQSWYKIMEDLKAAYPFCILEGCAAGGMRCDIREVLTMDCSEMSDNTNPVALECFFEQGALRLPAYRLLKWFVVHPGPNLFCPPLNAWEESVMVPQYQGCDLYTNLGTLPLPLICLLMISSNVSLSGNFLDLSASQKDTIKQYLQLYKTHRDMFRRGTLLLGHEPGTAGQPLPQQHIQYADTSADEHLVFAFSLVSNRDGYCLHLRNLNEDVLYAVDDLVKEERIGIFRGRDLMKRGLYIDLPTLSGRMLRVTNTVL